MTPRKKWPEWLRKADTVNPKVEIKNGVVRWHDGAWFDGKWHDGIWLNGKWYDGEWRDGLWVDGEWHNGEWRNGLWRDGLWCNGIWHDGDWFNGDWMDGLWYGGKWHHGRWHSGNWRDSNIDRAHFMAFLAGLSLVDKNTYVGYRTTYRDGSDLYDRKFKQPEGRYYEESAAPAGAGTCARGIQVTGATHVLAYADEKPQQLQLWRVRFKKTDLLDCDGEKARIRGGYFEKVEWPF